MILAPHMLAGAALATSIHQPILLAASAIGFHYLFDILPHWEYDFLTPQKKDIYKIVLDIGTGLAILFFVMQGVGSTEQLLLLWGSFFGIVPDGFSAIYFFSHGKYLRRQMRFHVFWHSLIVPEKTHPPLWLGLATEIIVIAVSLFVLLL